MEKVIFGVPLNKKEETYETIMSISKNNDYTTGSLLDYEYFSKHYKIIATDLSKKLNQKPVIKGSKLLYWQT